jgi:hypothetical protein
MGPGSGAGMRNSVVIPEERSDIRDPYISEKY